MKASEVWGNSGHTHNGALLAGPQEALVRRQQKNAGDDQHHGDDMDDDALQNRKNYEECADARQVQRIVSAFAGFARVLQTNHILLSKQSVH